jgi:NADPH-dependent glutamate synthase beta subunit-like oxidoreductase/CO/xanthine dehydrogenase FAD-binding subunit
MLSVNGSRILPLPQIKFLKPLGRYSGGNKMKSLMKFNYINATTIDDAVKTLRQYGDKARVLAGGSDLVGTMRFEVLRNYPEVVINLKTIPGLDYIKEEDGILKIGALTRLEDIAINPTIKSRYGALAEAAHRTASPHIRAMGTIGGNICQLIRCWYLRKEDNQFDCIRKGGAMCYAILGDNRYHSIFGSVRVGATPCSSACPTGVDIPSYLSKIRESNIPEAAGILLGANPVPAITGRVCPHFCEGNCNRAEYDEAISVRSIERHLGDYVLTNADKMYHSPVNETGKRVAIVGSGPAGLAAAYYLRKAGHAVTIFENMPKAGGLLTYGIPSYRLPKNVVEKQIKALQKMGIQLKLNAGVDKDKMASLAKSYDAVFLACGAWKERSSGIKGEALIKSGMGFLRDVNAGTRELPGHKVAVIGGGNVAIDVARTLVRLGAEPVVIYRRGREEMPALNEEVEKAEQEGIMMQFLTLPVVASKQGGKIALKCTRMELGPVDDSGRPRPVPVKGSEFIMEFDAVMGAYGEQPDYSIVPGEFLSEKGQLKTGAVAYCLGANIFAGGDFVSGPKTVVEAICAGREAAGSIDRHLGGKRKTRKGKGSRIQKSFDSYNIACLEKSKRMAAPELPVNERIKSLDVEDVSGLSLSEVETEANKCFNCGCEGVNPSDMAPALVALGAKIVTSRRTINADEFWAADKVARSTLLENDEIVTEIQIQKPADGTKSAFIKFALRKSIDFPIINCAAAVESWDGVVKSARICLNAVYSNPYRATKAEDIIKGKAIDEENAEAAGTAGVADAIALPYNKYKIQIAKTLVKRTILACK